MTQFAKEEIRQNLLAAAKEEFMKLGFENASIRTIAMKAKTAKSNLYNYFADKDALFCAVLDETVKEIREGLKQAKAANEGKSADTYTMESQEYYMRIVMHFVATHPQEISLLLYSAGGSSLEGFKEEVLREFTDILGGWLNAVLPGRAPSLLFIRCVAGFYILVIEQMQKEKPSADKAGEYMKEFLKFVYGGWLCVMQA